MTKKVTHQTIRSTIRSLENIGILAVNEKFDNVIIKVVESLRDLGIKAVEKENEEVVENVTRSLERIGNISSEQKMNEDISINITLSLFIIKEKMKDIENKS